MAQTMVNFRMDADLKASMEYDYGFHNLCNKSKQRKKNTV